MTQFTGPYSGKLSATGMALTVGATSTHLQDDTNTDETRVRLARTGPEGGHGRRNKKFSAKDHLWALFVIMGMTAFAAGRADAGLLNYSFTATDGGDNVGSGTFSYDTDMSGFTLSSTHVEYSPSAGQALVTIDFTSAAGTFSSSLSGSIDVFNDDPRQHDEVEIGVNSPTGTGGFALDTILFSNNADTAFSSTALPDSYNLASFPNFHVLEYYDPSIQDFRSFTITSLESVGAVPEPASLLMFGTGVVGLFGYMRLRKAKVSANNS